MRRAPWRVASPDVLTWAAPPPPRPRPSRGSSTAVPKASRAPARERSSRSRPLPGRLRDVPLPARLATPRPGRARPAAGGDAAGADRRHGRARSPPRQAPPQTLPGRRRRAGDRTGPPLPAAQPAARPGARTAAGERRDPAARHLRADARARSCRPITPASIGSRGRAGRPDRRPVAGAGAARPRPRSTRQPEPRARRAPARSATASSAPSRPGAVRRQPLRHRSNTAAGDALYAETLYIMLAVPGALIALGLAYLAALGTVERDRRDLALLRARGASRRDLLTLAGARERRRSAWSPGCSAPASRFAAVALLVERIGAAHLGARVAVVVALRRARRSRAPPRRGSATGSRRSRRERRRGSPRAPRTRAQAALAAALPRLRRARAQRADLLAHRAHRLLGRRQPGLQPDALALGLHVLRARRCSGSGRRCCWSACADGSFAWLARRGCRRASRRAARLPARQRRPARRRRSTAGWSSSACCSPSASASGSSPRPTTSRPASTRSSRSAPTSPPPRRPGVTAKQRPGRRRSRRVPGRRRRPRRSTTPTPTSARTSRTPSGSTRARSRSATTLRDSYFIGGGAADDAARGCEHARRDPRLQGDDHRLLAEVGRPAAAARPRPPQRQVPRRPLPRRRHRAGVPVGAARLVHGRATSPTCRRPTAPAGPTSSSPATSEDPATVAARVAAATRGFGVSVKDIRQQAVQTVSSITTVDLTGISRLEQAFAIVLAAAAMWLFVSLVVSERRHEFATMAALGASLRDIGAFVRSEAVAVLGARRWRWPPCSAGCWRRCWSRCSSTSSTRRPTTSRSPGASSGCSGSRRRWAALLAAALAARARCAACRSARSCARSDGGARASDARRDLAQAGASARLRISPWRRVRRIVLMATVICLVPAAVSYVAEMRRTAQRRPRRLQRRVAAPERRQRDRLPDRELVLHAERTRKRAGRRCAPCPRSGWRRPGAESGHATPYRATERQAADPPALPGEGVWRPAAAQAGPRPPVLLTTFRSDPEYPQFVAGVAWIDSSPHPPRLRARPRRAARRSPTAARPRCPRPSASASSPPSTAASRWKPRTPA